MQENYIERILKARVYDVAIESPLEPARRLSRRLGNDVLFKREDLQPVFSFKLRGAYNKIAGLDDAVPPRNTGDVRSPYEVRSCTAALPSSPKRSLLVSVTLRNCAPVTPGIP